MADDDLPKDGVTVRFIPAADVPVGVPQREMILFAPVDPAMPSDITDILNEDGTPKAPWREWPQKGAS